jgi:hypothetical protein
MTKAVTRRSNSKGNILPDAAVVLALAAFIFVAQGFSSVAEAQQDKGFVRLDNFPNNGSISGTDTDDNVYVVLRWFVCGQDFYEFTITGEAPIQSGQHDFHFPFFVKYSAAEIDLISVVMPGEDWFWLDQIELFNASAQKIWSSGIDNTQGWCFSSQPSDGNNTVCEPDGSRPSNTWNISSQCSQPL